MDPLRKGIAIGMLFGSGKEAELNDKEVEIDVGDILNALTGIFTYNPEYEDPQGDPPGPWDGYSLFTIDLTAVKQSLEDIIAALQQHDPDYDPDETPPEDAVEDLVEENEQQEQTIEDLTEQVEECDQCKADVIAKLQEYDPDFDPQTCKDIPPEIDEVAGYEFPENTPKEKIDEITGLDTIFDPEFDYYVKYYSVLSGRYGSDQNYIFKYGNIYETLYWQDPGAGNAIGFYGYIEVYRKNDNALIDRQGLGTWQGFLYSECWGRYENVMFNPTTGTYTMDQVTYTPWGGGTTYTRTASYQNNLLIGYGTSGKWKVKNS